MTKANILAGQRDSPLYLLKNNVTSVRRELPSGNTNKLERGKIKFQICPMPKILVSLGKKMPETEALLPKLRLEELTVI